MFMLNENPKPHAAAFVGSALITVHKDYWYSFSCRVASGPIEQHECFKPAERRWVPLCSEAALRLYRSEAGPMDHAGSQQLC
jgi:hypothetical protein